MISIISDVWTGDIHISRCTDKSEGGTVARTMDAYLIKRISGGGRCDQYIYTKEQRSGL